MRHRRRQLAAGMGGQFSQQQIQQSSGGGPSWADALVDFDPSGAGAFRERVVQLNNRWVRLGKCIVAAFGGNSPEHQDFNVTWMEGWLAQKARWDSAFFIKCGAIFDADCDTLDWWIGQYQEAVAGYRSKLPVDLLQGPCSMPADGTMTVHDRNDLADWIRQVKQSAGLEPSKASAMKWGIWIGLFVAVGGYVTYRVIRRR